MSIARLTITQPYLQPALIGSAAISFLISFENSNTTLMLVGSDAPLTVMMYSRMREGPRAKPGPLDKARPTQSDGVTPMRLAVSWAINHSSCVGITKIFALEWVL